VSSTPVPRVRPRRLRESAALRRLVSETRLDPADLVLPIFVREGVDEAVPIASMPGVVQHSLESVKGAVTDAAAAGIGGVMLGLGRALGETMAVTFVIGNAHRISGSILAPGTTISATIANEFTEAVEDIYTSSLIALGLLLFIITFIVLAIARLMLMRLNARVGA